MKLKNSFDAMSGIFIVALVILSGRTLACTTQAWEEDYVGGVVSAATAARFEADCGLRLDLSGDTSGWVEDHTPGTLADVTEYVARFYAYIDDAGVIDGTDLTLFSAEDASASANELFGLQLKGSGGDAVLHLYAYHADGTKVHGVGDVPVPPGWRALALHWKTGSGTGSVSLSIDNNADVQTISGLNNAGYIIEKVLLGVVAGNSSVTGLIDVDSFTSRRTGSAGLVNRSCDGPNVDNITFLSGPKNCNASAGLVFASRVTFDSGADVNVAAQTTTLTGGTRIPAGAILAIQ